MHTGNDLRNSERRNLWLVGMMGSGKTSVGRLVARRAGRPFVDIDAAVVARVGRSIAELWGKDGEEAFRDLEATQIAYWSHRPQHVLATGGGAVLRRSNVTAMRRSGIVVWLRADAATIVARLAGDTTRPLLAADDPATRLAHLSHARTQKYLAAADHHIDTRRRAPEHIAAVIEDLWLRS